MTAADTGAVDHTDDWFPHVVLVRRPEHRLAQGFVDEYFICGTARTTPALDQCGVAGVMRRAFLVWVSDRGEPVIERSLPAAELAGATAMLLTNAVIGAWPVSELAGRALAIDPQVADFNAWVQHQ